jgi:hypothetical protein
VFLNGRFRLGHLYGAYELSPLVVDFVAHVAESVKTALGILGEKETHMYQR